MQTAMRPRYYCDHCKKGSGSPSAMKRHESGCTANPKRVCRMCILKGDLCGELRAPPRDELVGILDANGFAAMCEAAEGCPACILSALRTKTYVAGPEDGREVWSYAKAKEKFWSDINDARMEQREY